MVQIVAFSPDGTCIVSAAYDLTLHDSVSAAVVTPPLRGHEKTICSVAFSPDSNRIASGSGDQTARIWDIVSGADPISLHGHDSDVWVVIFSPDGTCVVTGLYDHTIRVRMGCHFWR
jgi:WD40 repeat protein